MTKRYSEWKFSFLLSALICLVVLQAFFEDFEFHRSLFHAFYAFLLIAVVLTFARDKRFRFVLIVLAILTVSLTSLLLVYPAPPTLILVDRLICVTFMGLTTAAVLHRVLKEEEVTVDTLFGSVCAYLLVAATWGVAYSTIAFADPHAFQVPDSMNATMVHDPLVNVNDWIYFSFMTLTTVGLTEVMPVSRAAGTLTWMEGMAGQFYLALLVSRLVSLHVAPRSSAQPRV